ncbi:MAG: restriction endonuclease [Candidatus Tectimicrobiota bacterium]
MRLSNFDIATYQEAGWCVNDEPVDADVGKHLDERTSSEISSWGLSECPYCKISLRSKGFTDILDGNEIWHNNRLYASQYCERCAYWEFYGNEGGNKCMDPSTTILISSIAAKFSPNLPESCSTELAQQLRRRPTSWHNLSPKRMETLVADIFRANYQHSEVIHVGRPGDRGVDVIFIDTVRTKWLIQVKRRARARKSEGFATLQSLLGTMTLEGERHGMIATTADSFSYQARQAQRQARQQGYLIELYDKGVLDRIIGTLLPQVPWHELFGHPSLDYVSDDVRFHFWGPECDGQLSLL